MRAFIDMLDQNRAAGDNWDHQGAAARAVTKMWEVFMTRNLVALCAALAAFTAASAMASAGAEALHREYYRGDAG